MRVGQLTESLEDYLETIFRLLQKQKVARVRDIAKATNVKTSSVISALRRLAKEELVEYKAREYVDLTESGRELAFRLYQRHTFLKRFLTDLLQVDPETAEKDACSLEHAISLSTLDRIVSLSEFLSYCPEVDTDLISHFRDRWLVHLSGNGNEIHAHHREKCHATNKIKDVYRLADLEKGSGGFIARVTGVEKIRLPLIRTGVLPGASIRVIDIHKDGGMEVHIAGEKIILDAEQSNSIAVWQQETWESGGKASTTEQERRTLADMTPGRSFKVLKVTAGGEIRQRMVDMGFIRGAKGEILREALLRDPIEVELGGTLLSLRRVEATGIIVEELDA